MAETVLRDYVERVADEELLARSSFAARRAPFRLEETEKTIRRFRTKQQ